jgi:outer membrane immunogenic protein
MKFHWKTSIICMFVVALLAASSISAQDFSGFYFGGNAGAALGRSDANTTTVFSPTGYFAMSSVPAIATAGAQHLSSTDFTGGMQAGYDIQKGSFVVGIEGEFGRLGLNQQQSTTAVYPCCSPTTFTITQSVKSGWELGIRPRVGFVLGRVLLYATGGMAVTDLNYQEIFTDTFATALETGGVKKNAVGWTAGGGVEFHVAHHISVRGEYLFDDFGNASTTSTNLVAYNPATAFPTSVFTHSTNAKAHVVRLAVNYWF